VIERLKSWAKRLTRDVLTLWFAARSHQTPWAARLLAGAVAAYALSPIDLIPDFIPVLGYLDDLLIVPLGIYLTLRLIPAPLLAEFRAAAEVQASRPRSMVGAGVIVVIWLLMLVAAAIWWRGAR
jgi:uncharacterized membrane protein YkvA (DUF1232 family)